MKSSHWTFAQYSLVRFFFGGYLLLLFFQLMPWGEELFSSAGMLSEGSASPLVYLFPNPTVFLDHPLFIGGLFLLAIVSSVFLMLGYKERWAALLIWFLLTILGGRNPLSILPAMPYFGWLLLFIACLPKKENWSFPRGLQWAVWVILAIGYTYSGWVKLHTPEWFEGEKLQLWLDSPFVMSGYVTNFLQKISVDSLEWMANIFLYSELFFIPLIAWSKTRPFVWFATLLMHTLFLGIVDVSDLMVGLLFMHLFAFNPGWIKPKNKDPIIWLFYNTKKALSCNFVRFTLSEETLALIRFAPLESDTYKVLINNVGREGLSKGLVAITSKREILQGEAALFYVLQQCGGLWRLLSFTRYALPRSFRDYLFTTLFEKWPFSAKSSFASKNSKGRVLA